MEVDIPWNKQTKQIEIQKNLSLIIHADFLEFAATNTMRKKGIVRGQKLM